MHYKDGMPATLGDIVQHDSGAVGIVIGGTIGSDTCSTHAIKFVPINKNAWSFPSAGFVGILRDEKGEVVKSAAVAIQSDSAMQTRECLKIGHVDIGHG